MISRIAIAVCIAASLLPSDGGTQSSNDQVREAIVNATLDYADGYLGGSPERMTRALSPLLLKRQLVNRPAGDSFLSQMNAEMLIDGSHGVKLAPELRKIRSVVHHQRGDTASATIFSSQFNDHIQLIRRDGRWQLLNVLWHAPPAANATSDDAAVEAAVRALASAGGDATQVAKVMHPLASIRVFTPAPAGRPRIVRELALASLLANARQMQTWLGSSDALRITVESTDVDIAAARIDTSAAVIYLHLALQNGEWRVAHMLVYPSPPPA